MERGERSGGAGSRSVVVVGVVEVLLLLLKVLLSLLLVVLVPLLLPLLKEGGVDTVVVLVLVVMIMAMLFLCFECSGGTGVDGVLVLTFGYHVGVGVGCRSKLLTSGRVSVPVCCCLGVVMLMVVFVQVA